MPRQPIQHNLIDPSLHDAVEADGKPREARYLTTYDDGTTGETQHMLYRDGEVVRSVALTDWPAEQAALAARDAARAKRLALQASLRTAAQAHRGKDARALTLPELRDLVLILLEERGLLDDDGRVAG